MIRKHLHRPKMTDEDRKPYKGWTRDELIVHLMHYEELYRQTCTHNVDLVAQRADVSERNALKAELEAAQATLAATKASWDSACARAAENYEALERANRTILGLAYQLGAAVKVEPGES